MSDPDSKTSLVPAVDAPTAEIVSTAPADATTTLPGPEVVEATDQPGTASLPAAASLPTAAPSGSRPADTLAPPKPEAARASSASSLAARWRRPALAAGLAIGAVGLGVAGDRLVLRGMGASASRLDTALIEIRQSQEEIGRLRGEVHGLRIALDGGKQARTDLAARQAQLTDRVERGSQDMTARLGKLGEQLDRIEKGGRDAGRLAGLADRLDKLEKGAAIGPVASAAAPAPGTARAANAGRADVTATGSLPAGQNAKADGKTADPRKTPVEGYVLRDVDGSHALVEGRNGRLFEVTRGTVLPGLGKVEGVERRGRQWVVVTPKGYIGEVRPARSF